MKSNRLRAVFFGAALLFSASFAAIAAPAKVSQLKCAPGWQSEVVAEAPFISAPSVVCCSPDGRIFMGEDFMDMGSPSDKPGDSIVCIYPNGTIKVFATNLNAVFGMQYIDGKLYVHHTPKFSVFDDHDGVGSNRVDLITNDNPHPGAPSFNDHIPSGFQLAMDGYFYISTGDKGVLGAVGTDGRKIEMRGGVYRMRPDGTGLEVYSTGTRNHLSVAINSEDEMFTYDNTDDGGGWWSRVTHMVDGGFYGYPYDYKPQRPYTLWCMADYGSGAATGTLIYDEDALPEEYRGNMFCCEFAGGQVYRLKIKRAGETYSVESRVQFENGHYLPTPRMGVIDVDFLTRGGYGENFRPVGITVTPDGMGFYVTDWGLPGWKRGDVLGRLFKVTYTGKSLAAPKPKWFIPAASGKKFSASTAELVRALSHPAESVRLVAQRRLAERRGAAEGKLASLLKNTKAPPYARWSALWTLDAIDGGKKEHKAILKALLDKDATVESQAARELGTRQVRDAVNPLVQMLDSTNAMLRFRAATALGRIGDPAAVRPLKHALEQTNLFARYAAFKALNRIGLADGEAWPQIVEGLDSVSPRIREGVSFATRETYDVDLVKALTGFVTNENIPTEPRTNVLTLLTGIYLKQPPWNGDWWSTVPVNGSPTPKSDRWAGSSNIIVAMRMAVLDPQLSIRRIAFDWVRAAHDTNMTPILRGLFERETNIDMRADILKSLPAADDADTRAVIGPLVKNPKTPAVLVAAALEDVEKMNSDEWSGDLIRIAENPPTEGILVKVMAIFGEKKMTQTSPFLGKEIDDPKPNIEQAAVSALTQMGGDAAIAQFVPKLNGPSVDVRRRCITALGTLKAKSAVPQLLQLSSNNDVGVDATMALTAMPDLSALDVYLNGLGSKNASLRNQCKTAMTTLLIVALPKIEGKLSGTNDLPDEVIAGLKDVYKDNTAAKKGPLFKRRIKVLPIADYQRYGMEHTGDSLRGRLIFTDVNGVNCIRCHTISGQGAKIGPELTDIAMKQGRAQIIESILYPSKQILDGYQQVFFYMKDDDDYAGIIRSETPDTVTLIDSMGKTNVLQKSKIQSRKVSQISLMPDGLQTGLTLEEFSDLVAYLETPTRPRPRPGQAVAETPVKPARVPAPLAAEDPFPDFKLPPLPFVDEVAAPVSQPVMVEAAAFPPPPPPIEISKPAANTNNPRIHRSRPHPAVLPNNSLPPAPPGFPAPPPPE